jgi:hypothetical protein
LFPCLDYEDGFVVLNVRTFKYKKEDPSVSRKNASFSFAATIRYRIGVKLVSNMSFQDQINFENP